MKGISKKAFHCLVGLACCLTVFMMMSMAVEAAELNVGAAAILDSVESDESEETDDGEVSVTAGAAAGEAVSGETEETVADEADAAAQTAEADADGTEELAEVQSQIVMANVESSVNVRETASEEATMVGKLFKDCSGTILEQTDGWTKIESGNVVGWVSNDYLIFGEEAEELMAEVGSLKATVTTDALRVRKEAGEGAGVYKLVKNGEVLDAIEELDGWVSVQVDEDTVGYVSADYVSVEFATDYGKTTQEIEDEERAQELKKLTKNQGAVPTSVSDVTLLAALIQAEAGSQSYEGKLAVGAVVMNRVRSSAYPNTIIGVITAAGQFPPATNGTVAAIIASGPSSSCIQAAEAAVAGQTNVGGALHFGRVGKAAGVVIGSHVFY